MRISEFQGEKMKPGIYYDMPSEEYRSIKAINYSSLKHYRKSPAHYLESKLNPQPATDQMILGNAIHTAVLEWDKFVDRYFVIPENAPNKPTKRQTEAKKPSPETVAAIEFWEKLKTEAGSREILTREEFDACTGIVDSIRKNQTAKQVFRQGKAEVSLVWIDPVLKVLCKARIDWNCELGNFDPKSCVDARKHKFQSDAVKLGYHIQAAFYSDGWEVLTGDRVPFVFIAIEKKRPHCLGFYALEEDDLSRGSDLYRKLIRTHLECEENQFWPGYDDLIQTIKLPKWEIEEIENYDE